MISKNTTAWNLVTASVLMLLMAPAAHAHVDHGSAGGFSSGFSHPWSGWDHVIAMIAVGLWGAQLGAPALWRLPVAFPMIMALGGFAGLVGLSLPGVELGIGLSAVVLGMMVAVSVRPPLWAAAVVVGIFGAFHGHAHGTELPEGQDGLVYSLGFVVATGCLHGVGIAIGAVHQWSLGRILVRASGALIACLGVVFCWEALA